MRTSRFQNLRQAPKKRAALGGLDAAALFLGLSASFTVRLIGTLQVSEIAMFLLLPFLLVTQHRKILQPGMKTVYVLMGFWLFGQILTDIYRQTIPFNWMRGDARILFFALNLATLTLLLSKNVRRQAVFVAGYGVGSLLAARLQPTLAVADSPWKFGYAEGTMALVILLSCYFHYRKRYWIVVCLIGSLVVANLLLNFRSPILFLMVTIALVIPLVPERVGRVRILPRAGTPRRVVVLVCIALSFGGLAGALVHFVTRAGWAGAEAQEKNLAQSQSLVGVLLGGRPEIFVSSRAVLDSPILGHGSWAEDLKYTEMLYDVAVKYDIPTDNLESIEDTSDTNIPAHSHIMSSWVQAGILGAVFWAYALWIAVKGLTRTALAQPPLAPYYTWLLVGFVWDVFFSPFNNTGRSIDSLVIIFALEVAERFPMAGDQTRRFFRGGWRRMPERERPAVAVRN